MSALPSRKRTTSYYKAQLAANLAFFFVLYSFNTRAQNVACPFNIDFSFGNFNNWTLSTGLSNCGGTCLLAGNAAPVFGSATVGTAAAGRHLLMTGSTPDQYGNFTRTAPGGGIFSVRLGKDSANYRSERARYTIHVAPGFNDYALNFKYAFVTNDTGGHLSQNCPSFTVRAIDSVSGAPLPCANLVYNSGSPGILTSSTSAAVRYLPWTSATLNLSGQAGRTIIVEVTALSCGDGNHWAYGYFDVISCGHFRALVSYCDLKRGIFSLTAPDGYANYKWYKDSLNGASIYSSSSPLVNMPIPSLLGSAIYYCIVSPFGSNGCVDTLKSPIVRNFQIKAMPDGACNSFKPLNFIWVNVAGTSGYTTRWLDTGIGMPDQYGRCPIRSSTSNPLIPVVVTDSIGCYRIDTVQQRPKIFSVDSIADTTTCLGTSFSFTPVVNPSSLSYVYRWEGTNASATLSDSTVLSPVYTPLRTGYDTLMLRVSAANCESFNYVRVRTLDNDFHAAGDTACAYSTIVPDVHGDTSLFYTWSPDMGIGAGSIHLQAPPILVDRSRLYTITASYPGCPDVAKTISVVAEPQPLVEFDADTLIKCADDPLQISVSVSPEYGEYAFEWGPNANLTSLNTSETIFNGMSDTTLYITVYTPHGCTGQNSVRVQVEKRPFVQLTDSASIYLGDSYQMNPISNGQIYSWSPVGTLSDATIRTPIARPTMSTTYVLVTSNAHGCKSSDTIYVQVRDESEIAVPNGFTPDGTKNNILMVLHQSPVVLRYFRIFNRWGNLVFESNDITKGWDGTNKGGRVPSGVYVYSLEAMTYKGATVRKSGNISLLR